jgi:glutathione S-transferase
VECALLRCKLRYRNVRASTWEEDSARDELAKLNPLGQTPTLQLPVTQGPHLSLQWDRKTIAGWYRKSGHQALSA